jgi:hypothetical protein
MLAHSEQTAGCTYVSWTYAAGYSEPAPGTASVSGTCYLKNGTARVPTGATYRAVFAGAAKGVVFSPVSRFGTLSHPFVEIRIHLG